MAADDFFNRWSRRNAEAKEGAERKNEAQAAGSGVAEPPQPPAPPTMDDVERLTRDSDYSRFVAAGVDENVKRSALKKLFSDPHFNVMDRLDIYIDDYSKPDPIPAAMLAMLEHAKGLLDPHGQAGKPLMRIVEDEAPPTLQAEARQSQEPQPDAAAGEPGQSQSQPDDAEQAGKEQGADDARQDQERPHAAASGKGGQSAGDEDDDEHDIQGL